jgi:sulfur carrier protein ThiS
MTIKLLLRDKTFELKSGMTLRSALEKAGIPLESVLAVRAGEMLTEEELLKDGDIIKLVSVVSGG